MDEIDIDLLSTDCYIAQRLKNEINHIAGNLIEYI